MKKYGNLYWRVTSDCNADCVMCLRNHEDTIRTGFEVKLLNGAEKLGFQTVVFTGGEPTMRKDLPALIKITSCYDFNIRLDTNAILMNQNYLKKISKNLTMIGLPLHSSSPKLHDSITRVPRHFEIIKNKSKIISEQNIPIKITSAVGRRNLHDIENIAGYLIENIHPKVYAINAIVKGAMNQATYEAEKIEFEEFEELKKRLNSKKFPFKLSFCYGNQDAHLSYVFVNPDFTVTVPYQDNERIIGDLKNNSLEEVLSNVNINLELHLQRFKDTSL